MIEPSEEVQRAYAEAWYRAFGMDEDQVQRMVDIELREPMPWRVAALKAAIAVIERDRCLEPRDHVFHPLDRYRAPSKWPAGRGAKHPHFCVSCSDGETQGPGCVNCRSTGFDQSPWPHCAGCAS